MTILGTAGTVMLTLALIFSCLQSLLPLWGYLRNNTYALAVARPGAIGQFLCIVIAYALLTIAFANNDFSIAYVAANSHPSLPLMYRLTAVWGAHEGSILLWVFILSIWTIAFSLVYRRDTEEHILFFSLVLAILGLISFCFLCFLLLTSNPFLPASAPMSGHDLNPLLQDPGFVIHPPMLYTGYVGFAVAFAITQAALIRGKLDTAWASVTRQFALAAFAFLTFGIMLGSWWAYRVLGWGGFWFWDPVENASLLPWMCGIALIHVLVLTERRQTAKGWAALLAIFCFALSLLGTFLVRSGVLISAHTFASDPTRGIFLLLLFAILITAALALYVIRLPQSDSKPASPKFFWLSREMGLLINSALLFIAMLTVLLGTIYPLILDALHLGTISVGAPYFNLVMAPIVFLTMAFMGLGPLLRWEHTSIGELSPVLIKNMLLSALSALALLWYFTNHFELMAFISLSLSLWILLSTTHTFRSLRGMSLAHTGFAVLIIGIMLSSLLNVERDVRIKPGDVVDIGPYQFYFIDTEGVKGPNYRGIRAAFEVVKDTRHITNMYPEKRIYTVRDMVMTNVDIHPGLFRDLYLALGEPLDENYWSVRLYYKPFIRWIWLGGLLMILGSVLIFFQKKVRNTP